MKKIIIITVVLAFLLPKASAQIMLLDEDIENPRRGVSQEDISVIIPTLGSTDDQTAFVPLSGGMLLLVGMGGAYLIAKRKKKD